MVAHGDEIVPLAREDILAITEGETTFQAIVRTLRDADLASVSSAYLVDDRDEVNLEFLIALLSADGRLPIVVSLFNENIAPHLQAANPNVRVLNPAKIAAPAFVDALDVPLSHTTALCPGPHCLGADAATGRPPHRETEHRVRDDAAGRHGVFSRGATVVLDRRVVFRHGDGGHRGLRRHQPAERQHARPS